MLAKKPLKIFAIIGIDKQLVRSLYCFRSTSREEALKLKNLLSATVLVVLFGSSVASSNDSKIIQFYLNQLGFDSGVVDGKPGEKTKSALKKFYKSNTELEKVGINARNDLIKIAKNQTYLAYTMGSVLIPPQNKRLLQKNIPIHLI